MDGDCGESRSGGDATVGKARPALSRRHLEWRPRLHRLRVAAGPGGVQVPQSIGGPGLLSERGIASKPAGERRTRIRRCRRTRPRSSTASYNDRVAVGGANDYVNGGSQIYRDHRRRTVLDDPVPLVRGPRRRATSAAAAAIRPLTYSRRDHAFYFAQLCFFRAFLPSEIEVIRSHRQRQDVDGVAHGRLPGLATSARSSTTSTRRCSTTRSRSPSTTIRRARTTGGSTSPTSSSTCSPTGSATTARCRSPTPTTSTRTATAT